MKTCPATLHPMDTAPWYSRLTWRYLNPLLAKGLRVGVKAEDVWPLPCYDRVPRLLARFERVRAAHPEAPLFWKVARIFWRRWVLGGLFYLCWCVCAGSQPWLIRSLLDAVKSESATTADGLLLTLALTLAQLGYSFCINWKFHQLNRNGSNMRMLLMSLLFHKSMRLSLSQGVEAAAAVSAPRTIDGGGGGGKSQQLGSIGSVTNLMSNDTENLFQSQLFLHYLWLSPAFIVTLIALMWREIGPAALVGFLLLLCSVPLQARLGKLVGRTKRAMMKLTDERTELTTQLLKGMEVIKLYAWEVPLAERLAEVRERELRQLRVVLYVRGIMRALQFILPSAVAFATLGSFVYIERKDITLGTTVLVLSFITCIRFPMLLIPHAFALLFEGRVSMKRIEDFLGMPESASPLLIQAGSTAVSVTPPPAAVGQKAQAPTLVLRGSFTWDGRNKAAENGATENATLRGVSLDLKLSEGKVIGVIGRVGSGKTSLLLALLGELESDSTSEFAMSELDAVGYVAQTPAIVNGTIRDNIIFGLGGQVDEARLNHAVETACLEQDLRVLGGGMLTEIGEKGINLSGGQKARVAFARALYHRERCP